MKKRCIFCNTELRSEANYCLRCGEGQIDSQPDLTDIGGIKVQGCIKCGRQNEPNDAFCSNCGWYVKDDNYLDNGFYIGVTSVEKTRAVLRTDLPRHITDVTEYYEYFLLEMRHSNHKTSIDRCKLMMNRILIDGQLSDEQLDLIAVISADNVYKAAGWIPYINEDVEKYFVTIVRPVFDGLANHDRRVIYILDNLLDNQRLFATMKILEWCGFKTVLAKRAGEVIMLSVLLQELETFIQDRQNVFYIEPDHSVNYLNVVENATSKRQGYLQVLRNEMPTFQSRPKYRR